MSVGLSCKYWSLLLSVLVQRRRTHFTIYSNFRTVQWIKIRMLLFLSIDSTHRSRLSLISLYQPSGVNIIASSRYDPPVTLSFLLKMQAVPLNNQSSSPKNVARKKGKKRDAETEKREKRTPQLRVNIVHYRKSRNWRQEKINDRAMKVYRNSKQTGTISRRHSRNHGVDSQVDHHPPAAVYAESSKETVYPSQRRIETTLCRLSILQTVMGSNILVRFDMYTCRERKKKIKK